MPRTIVQRVRGRFNSYRLGERLLSKVSPETARISREVRSLIDDPTQYRIDETLHSESAARAIRNFVKQQSEDVDPLYCPGEMWTNILQGVATYARWERERDDKILADALRGFYRTDMINSFAGDVYFSRIAEGAFDFRRHVYSAIQRYRWLMQQDLEIDRDIITSSYIGLGLVVPYEGRLLTFKSMRHAYYVDRMTRFGAIGDNVLFGELGSGAGEMALIAKRQYPGATFVSFDLPTTLLVSTYNTLMHVPELKVGLYEDFADLDQITARDLRQFDFVMLPSWCLPRVEPDTFNTFYNVASLCEMDRPVIANYIGLIERVTSTHFYTVNRNLKVDQHGSSDIPLDEFPFSPSTEVVSDRYDPSADLFHTRYGHGMINYWERLLSFSG